MVNGQSKALETFANQMHRESKKSGKVHKKKISKKKK